MNSVLRYVSSVEAKAPPGELRQSLDASQRIYPLVVDSTGHYAAACFYSQQAAEKALKAVLYSRGSRVVLGHSVRELARQCEFARILEEATLLDQFYIPTRYPNGLPAPAIPSETYTASHALAAQQAAEDILRVVDTFLREI